MSLSASKGTKLSVTIIPLLAQLIFTPWQECPKDRLLAQSPDRRKHSLYVRIGEDGKRNKFTKCIHKDLREDYGNGYKCGKLNVTWSGDFDRGYFNIKLTDNYDIEYFVNSYECVRGGPGTQRNIETIAAPLKKQKFERGGWRYTEEYKSEEKKCAILKSSGNLYYGETRLISPPLSPNNKDDTRKKVEILEVYQDIWICKKKPELSI